MNVNKDQHEVLFEDEFLKVGWMPSEGDRILLCFTGIGHRMGGIDVQRLEFTGTGLKAGVPVFIFDKTRSWGNALCLETLAKVVERVADGRPRVAVGNSMGAFLAIATSKILRVSDVIAFAPQYSVNPIIVPQEVRWNNYRRVITEYRIPSLEFSFADTCRYHVFAGSRKSERIHWNRFPHRENVSVYVVPKQGHDIASYLKERNVLGAIVSDCLGREVTPPEIAFRYGFALQA